MIPSTVNFSDAWQDARYGLKLINDLGFSMDTFETVPGGRMIRVSVWSHKIDGEKITDPDKKRWIRIPAGLAGEAFFKAMAVKLKFLAGEIGA